MKKLTIVCLLIVGGLLNIFTTKLFYQHAGSLTPLHVQVSECLSTFSIYPIWNIKKVCKPVSYKNIQPKRAIKTVEVLLFEETIESITVTVNGKKKRL